MTHDPAVKAAQRAQMIPSLQEAAATGAREMAKPIRELHADLTEFAAQATNPDFAIGVRHVLAKLAPLIFPSGEVNHGA